MKRLTMLFALLLVAFTGACTKVTPGYVGIIVSTTGTQKNAADFPIQQGRVWFNPMTEDVYIFPTFLQNITWTAPAEEGNPNESITVNSVEGAPLNLDVALGYTFVPNLVPSIFIKFRQDAETITRGYMRNKVRGAFAAEAATRKVMDLYGPGRAEYIAAVKKRLNDELTPQGFVFDMVDIIGQPRLPENVQVAINSALAATQQAQKAENQLRVVQAEAAKQVAEAEGYAKAKVIAAQGEAEANRLRQNSLTDGILRQQAIEKWDGHFPQVISGGNNTPLSLILKQ